MQARADLQKILKDTSNQNKDQLDKMVQYQEIIVQESKTLTEDLNQLKQDKNCMHDEASALKIQNQLFQQEIEHLKLKVQELEGYKEKYEQQASVQLKSKEQ